MTKKELDQLIESQVKKSLREDNSQIAPQLMFLVNKLDELYYLFNQKNTKFKSPISRKVESDLKSILDIMLSDIQKQFPNFKIVNTGNGYNIVKK